MDINDFVGWTKINAICPARLQCHATVILALSTIAQESQQSASRGRVLAFYRIAPCLSSLLGSFSKPRRRRRRERHQTKYLMSKTVAMHVRFESLYISLPSSAKQQREMTKTRVKRRASHEPNPIQPMRLTWSSVFDPIKLDWFYLERLRRSSRLASREERLKTDFGSNVDFHMSRTKCIINVNQS